MAFQYRSYSLVLQDHLAGEGEGAAEIASFEKLFCFQSAPALDRLTEEMNFQVSGYHNSFNRKLLAVLSWLQNQRH